MNEVKAPKGLYAFGKLKDGDRFYFADDKRKTTHQAVEDGARQILTDGSLHKQLPTLKQRNSFIIYLRNIHTSP